MSSHGVGRHAAAAVAEPERHSGRTSPAADRACTVTRATGPWTGRAVRIAQPSADGRLDEEMYATVPQIDGFIQQLQSGKTATEITDCGFS